MARAGLSRGYVVWVAYMGNGECDYLRVDKVESGVRVQLVYDLCLRAFGPYGVCECIHFLPHKGVADEGK